MLKLKKDWYSWVWLNYIKNVHVLMQFTNTHTKIKHGYSHQDYLKGKISEKR